MDNTQTLSPTTVPDQTNISATSYTYTGLTGATNYNFYVRANCGGDVSSWKGVSFITDPYFGGEGTEENPYLIYTKEDIETLCTMMSNAWETYGKHFKLMRDIDNIINPIGSAQNPFRGDFDGNGYTINLEMIGYGRVALFEEIAPGASIHDLTVSGSVYSSASYAAGIVAYARIYDGDGTDDMSIINCINKADVSVNDNAIHAGGIIGYVGGSTDEDGSHFTIRNCENRGNISGIGHYHGGVIAFASNHCNIVNCINKGNVEGLNNTGGIVGRLSYNSFVSNCFNSGNITCTGNYVGGITGYCIGANIINSYNIRSITGVSYIGGIAGYLNRSSYPDLGLTSNVYNAGIVTASNTTYCGAIVGYVYGSTSTGYYGYVDGAYYKEGTYSCPFGSSSKLLYVTNTAVLHKVKLLMNISLTMRYMARQIFVKL